MIWWIVPAAIGFVGLVVTLTGLSRMGKRKVMSGGTRTLAGGLVLIGAGFLTLVGVNLQSYNRLTHERVVATVELTRLEQQLFAASVTLADESLASVYQVRGDEIAFEARIIKWEPWANIIGYDAIYKLERMTGRYTSIEDERTQERSVYRLENDPGIDPFDLINEYGEWQSQVDAFYGSGTYVPMSNGARYEIRITQNGLIARPLNDQAEDSLQHWLAPVDHPMRAE